MQYVSLLYLLVFLPAVLLLYRALPQRNRWKLLLAASYLFFFLQSTWLIFYLFFSTIVMHGVGLWLTYSDDALALADPEGSDSDAAAACARKKRRIVAYGVVAEIGLLLTLKYSAFFSGSFNQLLLKLPGSLQIPVKSFAVPIGISFYTLQSVSYISDVFRKRIRADDNLGRLALYMSFFPAVMEGPICRYSQTAEDLYAGRPLEYDNLVYGAQRIIWGLFKKLLIADRLDFMVNKIFGHYGDYGGIVIAAGAILYTLQLYADFSGCIDITIGTGELFGLKLPENFRQPFFSKTASEFWRRWHITLGTWFKDYIFFPLSLTRFVKNMGKKGRQKFGRHIGQIAQSLIPLLGVWMCNGLWHGAGWNYIFYGIYYFVLILLEMLLEPAAAKTAAFLHLDRKGFVWRFLQCVKMAVIIFTGELFFRASSLRAGFAMFSSIFTGWDTSVLLDGTMLKLGMDLNDYLVVAAGVIVLLVVGIIHEKGISIRERVSGMRLPVRWAIYLAAILVVLIFGAYGDGYNFVEPLYAGF